MKHESRKIDSAIMTYIPTEKKLSEKLNQGSGSTTEININHDVEIWLHNVLSAGDMASPAALSILPEMLRVFYEFTRTCIHR